MLSAEQIVASHRRHLRFSMHGGRPVRITTRASFEIRGWVVAVTRQFVDVQDIQTHQLHHINLDVIESAA
jgi:hypothetical protein